MPHDAIMPLHLLYPQIRADLPAPPYTAAFQDYVLLGVTFERDRVRHLVPAELELAPTVTGFIATGLATGGWPLAPFANFYMALAVEGLPSSDGTPGHFRALNIYSPNAAQVFRQVYNARMAEGQHLFRREGDRITAEVIAADGLTIRLTVRQPAPGHDAAEPAVVGGVHHYLGEDATGEITSFHTSYSARFAEAQILSFEVTGPDADARLPRPDFTWATVSPLLSVTIGEPRGSPFTAFAGQPGATALTTLLTRIGLAGACLGQDGQVLGANAAARALLRQVGPAALGRLVSPGSNNTVALPRDLAAMPVIAQCFPLDPALLGQAASLVLLRDPAAPGQGDPSAVLALLGLTPAEARLAVAVGSGIGPAEAAERLGIQLSTARSQLKVIFDKLNLSRQSELSRLVLGLGPG